MGRTYVRKLVDAGLRTRAELRAAGADAVKDVLRNKAVSAALWSALGRKKGRATPTEPSDAGASQAADGEPPAPATMVPAIVPARPVRVAEPAAPSAGTPAPTVRPASASTPALRPSVDASTPPLLTIDLAERRVVYRGVQIPTKPPRNIQRQPLLALAVLAEHAGQTITVSDLADEMRRVGHLARRLVAPEPRDLRYKLLAPFRHALKSTVSAAELDQLVESVSRNGLRLNVPGPVSVVAGNADRRAR